LIGARHPLLQRVLAAAGGNRRLVPLDVTLDRDERLMVITGPNAGGKTVALKTVGLCALLLQCGLQIPCEDGSEIPVFERIFVDIGDEQSIEDSLSTFTSHLKHLDAMTRLADDRSLCLLDEIGGGTDPDEGAALAISSLETLIESKAAVIATTHYGRIKAFALGQAGVINASMAFEDTEGRPLYRLLQGVAGRSRGLETARRTGFNPDVVARAEAHIGKEAFALESVLSDLEHRILELERERRTLEVERGEVARERRDYEQRSSQFRMTKKEADRRALREANEILVRTRAEVERIVQSIRERDADREAIREGRRKIGAMLDGIADEMRAAEPDVSSRLESVSVGDTVSLNETGSPQGIVLAIENSNATVEIEGKRIRLPVAKLFAASAGAGIPAPLVTHDASFEPLASTTLDVRGQEREEALAELVRFVDRAVLSGVEEVRIIHGIGGGILARAVREYAQDDRRVASTRAGEPIEGGVGVTFFRFA